MLTLATDNGVAVGPSASPVRHHPDLKLLEAGERLSALCDALIADLSPETQARVRAIAAEIALLPARTLEGMSIKAKAMRWSYFGDSYFEPMDFDAPIGRLFVSLLHDLRAFRAA